VSRVAAIGEEARLAGYALAGAQVHAAGDDRSARAAWGSLDEEVACLILTPAAHAALAPLLEERPRMLWAVVPD
jgi:vacuolar-type H+-ATPase subunit F/Vma7